MTATELKRSIKILETKGFARALEKQAPGLNKAFPVVKGLNKVKPSATTTKANAIISKLKIGVLLGVLLGVDDEPIDGVLLEVHVLSLI